jgi:murein DD-endopeptidase MepM/ murein hydrolase activator NlpD
VLRALVVALALAGTLLGGVAQAGLPPPPGAPTIIIASPRNGSSYQRGARVLARFVCRPGASSTTVVSCKATIRAGHALDTRSVGTKTFTVTATDSAGNVTTKTVRYLVWTYANPLRSVSYLQASRIDMGVDYSGEGPILAIGRAKVVLASDRLAGPESCWGKTCVPPPGDMIVYRLLDGPFAGKYIYVVEHITIHVRTGQTVAAGQPIAVLHLGSPNLEMGWPRDCGHGRSPRRATTSARASTRAAGPRPKG